MTRQTLCECIAKKSKVMYDGSFYIPTAYILRVKAGMWLHSAELVDLKHHSSIVIAPLERIELI